MYSYVFDGLTSSRIPPPIRTEMTSRPIRQLTSAILAKHWRSTRCHEIKHTKNTRATARPREQNAESLAWCSDSPQNDNYYYFCGGGSFICNPAITYGLSLWLMSVMFQFFFENVEFSRVRCFSILRTFYYPAFTLFVKKKRFSAPGANS